MTGKFYHGTSRENAQKILDTGFKTNYGRFGHGAYLTSNKLFATGYARKDGVVIECDCIGSILPIDYYSINKIFPNANVNVEEEEGYTDLEKEVRNMGYDGALIIYDENDDELVVYDTNCLKNFKKSVDNEYNIW